MPEGVKIDKELGDSDSFIVRTPDAVIYISTYVGTGVLVYEDTSKNPQTSVFIERKKT